jgi:DNA-binding NarL/FixJ family response regulator
MIRVVVADDHHLVRQGIRALLEKAADLEVVGEAADGQQAIELVRALVPDVLVIDIAMPRLNGMEAVSRLRAMTLKTRFMMLSMHSDETVVRQALKSGARGYILKRAVSEELLMAVRAVHRGDVFLSPEVSGVLVARLLDEGASMDPMDRLTTREREVLQLVAEGHTSREIAEALHLSEKTIEKHRASLMAKLKIRDTASLVRAAIRHGLVRTEE